MSVSETQGEGGGSMTKKTQADLDKEVEEVVRAFEEAGLTEENMRRNCVRVLTDKR